VAVIKKKQVSLYTRYVELCRC